VTLRRKLTFEILAALSQLRYLLVLMVLNSFTDFYPENTEPTHKFFPQIQFSFP
jgi:hypothetical protein